MSTFLHFTRHSNVHTLHSTRTKLPGIDPVLQVADLGQKFNNVVFCVILQVRGRV